MSRIDRRNKLTDDNIGFKHSGGMFDLFDNQIKVAYRINDDEYDHLCEIMTDEESDVFITEKPTYAQKRQMIHLLNKYLKYESQFS